MSTLVCLFYFRERERGIERERERDKDEEKPARQICGPIVFALGPAAPLCAARSRVARFGLFEAKKTNLAFFFIWLALKFLRIHCVVGLFLKSI